MRAASLLALLALTACGPEKDPVGETDADGDGVLAGDDCDDGDAAVFPGATEACNEVDDDCNGQVDDGASDARAYAPDGDGDGAPAREGRVADCAAPDGFVDVSSGEVAVDCDDARADVYPGAAEVCDGVDNDCDTSTTEAGTATLWTDGVPADVTADLSQASASAESYALGDGELHLCDGTFHATFDVAGEAVVVGYGDVTVDGDGMGTVFDVSGPAASLRLSDVLVTDGMGDAALLPEYGFGAGGGVACGDGADLSLERVTVKGNMAQLGGGLAADGCSSLVWSEGSLEENTAMAGGGYFATRGSATFNDVGVLLNQAESGGGGAYVFYEGALSLAGVTMRANAAGTDGDAIFLDDGARASCASTAANRGAFSRHANPGAIALYTDGSELDVADCDFVEDDASGDNATPDIVIGTEVRYRAGDASTFLCTAGSCGTPVTTEIGGIDMNGPAATNGAIGSVFQSDGFATLAGWDIYMGVSSSCTMDAALFSSYTGTTGTWTLEWSQAAVDFRAGVGWVSSGPVGYLLSPDYYYAAVIGFRCGGSPTTLYYVEEPPTGPMGAGEASAVALSSTYTAPYTTNASLFVTSSASFAQRFHVTNL